MNRKLFILGYIIYHICAISPYAQVQEALQNQYKFKYFTVDQGLSNNNVRSICQDSKGFIWLATQNGLNKFNGQSNETYWHNPQDSNTISASQVNFVFLDSKNNLWIANSGGLDLYNEDLNNFTRFKHKDVDGPLGQIFSITEDRDGKLWFGGDLGFYSYDLINSDLQVFSNKVGNKHNIPPDQILRLLVDRNNNLWISIVNKGICVYNQDNSTFKYFTSNPKDPTTLSGNRIEKIYEDSKGDIWLGSFNNGLNLYVPESNSFIRIIIDPDNSYSTRVRPIFEDLKGNFFVGTRGGLYIRNNLTHEFDLYAHEGHNFSKLSQNSLTASFIDKTGTLWIGTFSGGANYTNLNKKKFIHYSAGKYDNHFLSGANIYAIAEDLKGNLWVGGDNGLNYLDRLTYTFKYFFNDPSDPYSLSYNDIKALDCDDKGNLWIGTNKGGLNYYNVKTGKFKTYRHDPDDQNSIAGDKIYGLMNDKDNNLWLLLTPITSYQSFNIDILPNGSDKFIHLNEKANFGLDQGENGDVYIGGINGFWIFSKKDSIFSFISNDSIIDDVNVIKKDSKDNVWVGCGKGLIRYNLKDKSLIRYSNENGYPLSEVFGILEDNSNSLWVSTNNGLVKISNILENSSKIKFRVFDKDDGLQSKQFNYNAYYKSKSGEMAFGGINGFNTFFPDEIIENLVPPNVVLTNLKIFNSEVPIGKKVSGYIILNKSISVTNEITLYPHHNVFTIEFASLQNANPKKNTFKFKLEGFDTEWQYRKAGINFVTYTNLSAGKYTFLVTAANNDGVWNEKPVKLNINIVPNVWENWWFKIFISLIFIGLISGIYFYRLSIIRKQNVLLEKTVTKRTLEISEKNEEISTQNEELEQHRNNLESLVKDRTLKLEKALNQAKESDEVKSAFLANMSHEIRTPMNAITGFAGLLSDSDTSSDEQAEFIHIIQSNSKSLLNIIDEILDLSLIESKQLKLAKETFELNVLLDHIFSYYSLSINNTKIEVRKNNTLEKLNLKLNSDNTRMKQIITNLMDNASKFTEEGFVELGAYIIKDDLCIYVKDTGRGISSQNIDHIFKQFTKIEDMKSQWTRGLGLGLAISKKISEALGANILVESDKDQGSTFTLSIPMSNVITQNEIKMQKITEPIPNNWLGKTILIAEDVEANFLYLKKALKKTQTNIIWVKNGEEAIKEAFENNDIDLILMDIKMPKIDGYAAAKKIKEQNPNQIIIAQTAYARPEERLKFHDDNFDEYLSKPINPINLFMILEKFL